MTPPDMFWVSIRRSAASPRAKAKGTARRSGPFDFIPNNTLAVRSGDVLDPRKKPWTRLFLAHFRALLTR
jgi:hypothetical protein